MMVFLGHILSLPLTLLAGVIELKRISDKLTWLADEANEVPENLIEWLNGDS